MTEIENHVEKQLFLSPFSVSRPRRFPLSVFRFAFSVPESTKTKTHKAERTRRRHLHLSCPTCVINHIQQNVVFALMVPDLYVWSLKGIEVLTPLG